MLCGNVGTCPDTLSCKTTEKRCVFCIILPHHSAAPLTAATSLYTSRPQAQTPFKLFKILCNKTLNRMTVIIDQKYLQKAAWLFACINYKIKIGKVYRFLT
jgi:hypothetical protein